MTPPKEDTRDKLEGHYIAVTEGEDHPDGIEWEDVHPDDCPLVWNSMIRCFEHECALSWHLMNAGLDSFCGDDRPRVPGRYPVGVGVNVYGGIPGVSATEYDVFLFVWTDEYGVQP